MRLTNGLDPLPRSVSAFHWPETSSRWLEDAGAASIDTDSRLTDVASDFAAGIATFLDRLEVIPALKNDLWREDPIRRSVLQHVFVDESAQAGVLD